MESFLKHRLLGPNLRISDSEGISAAAPSTVLWEPLSGHSKLRSPRPPCLSHPACLINLPLPSPNPLGSSLTNYSVIFGSGVCFWKCLGAFENRISHSKNNLLPEVMKNRKGGPEEALGDSKAAWCAEARQALSKAGAVFLQPLRLPSWNWSQEGTH